MAKPTKSEQQALWEDRINRALKKREDDFEKPFRVKLSRQYLEGKQRPENVPADEWITINKIYSHMQAQLPILYSLDPFYYISIKKSFTPHPMSIALFEMRAEIRQDYLNYLKKELQLKVKARLSIQDAHSSYGVMKIHYVADEVENPDAGKPIKGEDGEELLDSVGNALIEPEVIPINERYAHTRIHPDDLLWSEDASTLEDKWHWLAERVRMTPEEANKRKLISKKVLKETSTQNRDQDDVPKTGIFGGIFNKLKPRDNEKTEDREVYVGWEIYDLDHKQWLFMLEGAQELAIKPRSLPPGVENHPYSILRFTLRDDSPYPVPPISQALDPQREYNETRSKLLVHRKRFNRKYEVFVGGLEDETELDKLEAGEDGTIIRVKVPSGEVVRPIKDAQLDQQTYIEINYLNMDMNEMMGSPGTAVQRAESDSATEAAILDKRLDIREGDRVTLVTDWLTDIGKKTDQLVQTHITKDEAIKVTGINGEQGWRLVRQTDFNEIEGEFEYTVDVGSTKPRLPEFERSSFLAFLQVLGGFPHIMTVPSLMKKLAKMYDINDDKMVEDLRQLGVKILSGEVPTPGQSGSQAGVSENNPITAALGAAFGSQGGTNNGGGSELLQQV